MFTPVITKWTEHPKIKAKRGDVLITVKGSGVGKINLLDEDEVAISRQLMAVRVTGAEPSFIHASLSSTFDHFQSLSTGAAIPGISREQVLGLTIALPPPAEQQRLVGLPDEAFEGLATAKANAEKNLQNARALFESHLQSVFTQRGKGWKEHTLGDLIEIQNGYAFKSTDYTDSGYFVIRISNVQDGEITLANPRFIKLADKKLERFILYDGDILISRTGNIGRVGIIQQDQLPAVLNQRVARITIKDQTADRDFLFRFLLSRTFRENPAAQKFWEAHGKFGSVEAKAPPTYRATEKTTTRTEKPPPNRRNLCHTH